MTTSLGETPIILHFFMFARLNASLDTEVCDLLRQGVNLGPESCPFIDSRAHAKRSSTSSSVFNFEWNICMGSVCNTSFYGGLWRKARGDKLLEIHSDNSVWSVEAALFRSSSWRALDLSSSTMYFWCHCISSLCVYPTSAIIQSISNLWPCRLHHSRETRNNLDQKIFVFGTWKPQLDDSGYTLGFNLEMRFFRSWSKRWGRIIPGYFFSFSDPIISHLMKRIELSFSSVNIP